LFCQRSARIEAPLTSLPVPVFRRLLWLVGLEIWPIQRFLLKKTYKNERVTLDGGAFFLPISGQIDGVVLTGRKKRKIKLGYFRAQEASLE